MESCKSDTGKPKDVLDTTKPTTTTVSEAVLSYEQVTRLDGVMQQVVPIHGRGNFPTLEIKLKDLVQVVKTNLANDDVLVKDIRINGGAASYVLAADSAPPYKDVDLIFKVSLDSNRTFDKIKNAVLDSLLNFLPEGVSKTRMSSCSLKEAYVHKMVKVRPTEGDRWSLISLNNNQGKNVELKFVDVMRRQFEFSVDSFQINLDSLFVFYDCSEMPMSLTFYPTIVAESVYGDFEEAVDHLHKKLIATRHPEEIRGGGLLKYCNLLVRDFKPVKPQEIKMLERYMCSRFFIDFNDIEEQRNKLENYLFNHFAGEDHLMCKYLGILYEVVEESTVCLMGHERRQSLQLIEDLACRIYYQDQQNYSTRRQHRPNYQRYNSGSKGWKGNRYYRNNQPGFMMYGPIIPIQVTYPCPCNWNACVES